MQRMRCTAFLLLLMMIPFAREASADGNGNGMQREELFFTYAGLVAEGGYSKVSRSGWMGDHQGTEKSTGYYYAPGLLFDVYVRDFAGEFRGLFMMNSSSDSKAKINHGLYDATAKYLFHATPHLDLTAGLGVYFEGAPSTKSYNGAGGQATLGLILGYTGRWDWKFVCDARFRYGYFGQDGKSSKMNAGFSVGVTRKVGRG